MPLLRQSRLSPHLEAAPAHRTRAVLIWTCLAVLCMRTLYVWHPLRSDEGGYLLLARHWRSGGEFLYGDYHVDRPPLLIMIFRLAALSDWDGAIRALTVPLTLVAVLAVARAGFLLGGHGAARWSALVAAALLTTPALAADQADGELLAVPIVAASLALGLQAWREEAIDTRVRYAMAAGALAASAALVKQNFLDGAVFLATLLIADRLRSGRATLRCRTVAMAATLGFLVPVGAMCLWALASGQDPARIWFDLVTFRGAALAVILDGSTKAPAVRAVALLGLALVSAALPLLWCSLIATLGDARRHSPQLSALYGGLGFAVLSIAAGGSYWPHYTLQLVPALALIAGMGATNASDVGAVVRRWARVACASAVAAWLTVAFVYAVVPGVWSQQRTGDWLAASSRPGDTAVVLYGNPVILEAADLPSPYPYLWSLPMRTLDPRQDRLRRLLTGPRAPSWVVQVSPLNAWQIDREAKLRQVLESRYDAVGEVCGNVVWLHSRLSRVPATPPRC